MLRILCVVIVLLVVSGCVFVEPNGCTKKLDELLSREMEQDVAYLTKLKARVKDSPLAEADLERLWQAHLVRSKLRYGKRVEQCYWYEPFVAPSF